MVNKTVKIGDAIEVLFKDFSDGKITDSWKAATVCIPEDDYGVIGAAFADGTRMMAGPRSWRAV